MPSDFLGFCITFRKMGMWYIVYKINFLVLFKSLSLWDSGICLFALRESIYTSKMPSHSLLICKNLFG